MDPHIDHTEEVKLDTSADGVLKLVTEKRLKMLLGVGEYKSGVNKDHRYLMNELAETAVQVKRIETDEKINADNLEVAGAFAKALLTLDGNPFHKNERGERELKIIEPEVPAIEVKPGETLVEMEALDYNDFVRKK